MFAIFILALLLRASYAEDCGHFFEHPIDICFSDGVKILCDDQSGSEIITVETYDNEMCTGQATIYDPQAEGDEDMDFSALCAAINGACSCSTTTCDLFEWDYEESCNYAEGGASASSGDRSVMINKCLPYMQSISALLDSVYYVKYECNENFDATDSSSNEMPVIGKVYSSSACDDSSFLSNVDSFELDDESCRESQGSYETECPYQAGSTGDKSVCSYFNHYPIGECATYYVVTDADEETYYEGDESAEIVCETNGTYSKNYYNSANCTGDITESLDITDYCIDCNCYDSDSDGDGDSLLCDIGKEGWKWRCSNDNSFLYDTTTFYVLEMGCINQTQFECQMNGYDDTSLTQTEYRDDECEKPVYNYSDFCGDTFLTTCNYNDVSDTTGCGYVFDSNNALYVLDLCYNWGYTDDTGSTNGNSFSYNCTDGVIYYNDFYSTNCSGPGYSYSISCTQGVDCFCGDGKLCSVAQEIKSYSCNGVVDFETDYYLTNQCDVDPAGTGLYREYSCSDTEGIEKIIYNSDVCSNDNIRSECIGYNEHNSYHFRDSVHECSNVAGNDQTNCGYYNDYPMDTCVVGHSTTSHTYSMYYYCTIHGDTIVGDSPPNATYHYDYYDSYDCSGQKYSSGTYYCNEYDTCNCVSGVSQCSTYQTETTDSCYGDKDFYVSVVAICESDSNCWNLGGACSTMDICSSDNDTSRIYYSDNECQVEKVDICTSSVNYDSQSEAICAAKWITTTSTTTVPNDSDDSGVTRVNMIRAALFVVAVLFWNRI